jgi:hypothetical protein
MNMHSQQEPQGGNGTSRLNLQPAAVARGLGWFSIGLGLMQLLAPRAVTRLTGTKNRPGMTRLYGLRELACGIGILASGKPSLFLWARVGGDAVDLGTLAAGRRTTSRRDTRRAQIAAMNVACVTALDVYAATGQTSAARSLAAPLPDYSNRSGFAQPFEQMRGAASADFDAPPDVRTPAALAPWVA